MDTFPDDIYTEPEPDIDTLANLGPLTPMAGIWMGERGLDVNLKADGPERDAYIEHYELQPIDAQTNGPQLLYGLRYHARIVEPDDPETFHDQVGYWLWEPAKRIGHSVDRPWACRALSPHGPQHAAQDRRPHA